LPKAQQIIDRLTAINYENPKICEQRIQKAFTQHLKALNLPNRPVEIYRSFDAAFDAAWEVMFFDAAWQNAINAAWKVVYDAAQEAAQEAARKGASAATSDAALKAARKAAFDAALAAAKKGTFDSDAASEAPHFSVDKAAREAAFRTAKKTVIDPLWNKAWNRAFDAAFPWAWSQANEAASSAARAVKGAKAKKQAAWGDAFNAAFRQVWVTARSYASMAARRATQEEVEDIPRNLALAAARSVARDAVLETVFDGDRNAAWRNIKKAAKEAAMAVEIAHFINSSRQYAQLCAVWMPFVDALEAGLFCFWMTQTKVIVLISPVMRIQNDQLHADGQPAVQWSDSECYYFWRGIQIPQKYGAVLSQNWRSQWLLEEPNAELRRVLIQGIGYERIVQELEAVELDTWREYSLLMIYADIDLEPIHLLKMTCPSTNHIHVLRTPPDITSAREAIAWCNWDIDPEQFSVES
jgi:hypothetical protein